MAATLDASKLQIKYKAGALASGKDSIKSVNLAGINVNADASVLVAVAGAIGDVIAYPVVGQFRIDTYAVE